MIRYRSIFVALPLLLGGCDNAKAGADASMHNGDAVVATTSPDISVGPVSAPTEHLAADGKARTMTFANGVSLQIDPVLITGRKPGIVAECAVRIAGQLLTTVGEEGSRTEVVECHGLDAAGALPDVGGARRIGLIYDSGTPNAAFKTPIVLIERPNGTWRIDDDAFDRLDGTSGNRSIEDMGKVLAR